MALSNPVTVEVHGLAELERALMQLPEAVAGKALNSAVASGINVIKRGAVNYVPVGSRGFYPDYTDGFKKLVNFKSCCATLRRILGLWNLSI